MHEGGNEEQAGEGNILTGYMITLFHKDGASHMKAK
jgi:hypothetical protein